MNISIVIISKDRRERLKRILRQVEDEDLENSEIVVIEATQLNPMNDSKINYKKIPLSEAGFSYQRNLGVKEARGDYIVFIDDDVEITSSWFKNLIRIIKEKKDVFAVMGAVFPKSPGIIGFCEGVMGHPGGGFKFHYFSKGKIIPLNHFSTCNLAVKKSAIENLGGFNEGFTFGGGDTDLSIRITNKFGRDKFRYNPDALVYHHPRGSIKKIIPWYLGRGKAEADLFLNHSVHTKYFFSTSILLKIIPVFLIGLLFKNFYILMFTFLIWYLLQLFRNKFMFKYFKIYDFSRTKRLLTLFIFPFIKLIADLMFDLGKILRLLKQRI